MYRVVNEGQESAQGTPMPQLFSAICKPAYSARLAEIIA